MEPRKTLTMNWDGLGDVDDDDAFFESYNRLSTAVPLDLASSSDEDDDDFDDARLSFVSAYSSVLSRNNRASPQRDAAPDYGIWMASPASITERRKRLLHGMGLEDDNEFTKATGVELSQEISKEIEQGQNNYPVSSVTAERRERKAEHSSAPVTGTTNTNSSVTEEKKTESSFVPLIFVRSRSEGDIDSFFMERDRKEVLIGKVSKQRLTRTASEIAFPRGRKVANGNRNRVVARDPEEVEKQSERKLEDSGVGAFFLIKNLDTGKDFIVNEYGENGMWNRLSDLQTGKQLTMDEFEKTVGKSRVVNELMRRASMGRNNGYSRKLSSSSYISRSLRLSKKRGAAWLKNIKGVASGIIGEREREVGPVRLTEAMNQWVRVRHSGKSYQELSALHLSQEFKAHEGCIWTIRFRLDGRYLASAGEDKVIHVWEVQECEVMSLRPEEGNLTPLHPSFLSSVDPTSHGDSPPLSNEKKKKGKFGSKRGNPIPEYVHPPETVFSLSEKPYCSFEGHLDDVLDLSWSKSQLLLSSSTDKTVRLWDLESKTCLNKFAHNDYVTCIQFNPINDDYFISGSLDGKVRIWSIPERHVVDWTDIHEMVTAVSYTPDGQGAFVGTHKGSCRTYSTEDCILSQTGTIEIRRKKKSQLRKVTGFQFTPGKPSEVLVTSADSRIRILDASEVVHKFKGFRNANSQIAASFSPDGRYIISASEDSQVYVWKHEEHRSVSTGKGRNVLVTRSHEHFQCKDVSIAIAWPCTIRGDPPPMPVHHSKRHSKGSQAPSEDSTFGTNSKRMLPPLPKKGNNHATECATNSPKEDPAAISRTESELGYSFANSKRMMSPLRLKTDCHTPEEEDHDTMSRTDSGISDSFSSGSSSIRHGNSPSRSTTITSSWSSSYSLLDSSHGSSTIIPSAWGLVIVTAGYGGEIRCYQNFGLPKKMSPHLFGGHNSFSHGNT